MVGQQTITIIFVVSGLIKLKLIILNFCVSILKLNTLIWYECHGQLTSSVKFFRVQYILLCELVLYSCY